MQTLHDGTLAAHAEECAFTVRALFDDFAVGVDLTTPLLRRPRQEQLGLDQMLPERGDNRFAQAGNIVRPTRAHYDAIRVSRAQLRFAFVLRVLVADVVDLVEDAETRNTVRSDLLQHHVGDFELALETGIAKP